MKKEDLMALSLDELTQVEAFIDWLICSKATHTPNEQEADNDKN